MPCLTREKFSWEKTVPKPKADSKAKAKQKATARDAEPEDSVQIRPFAECVGQRGFVSKYKGAYDAPPEEAKTAQLFLLVHVL